MYDSTLMQISNCINYWTDNIFCFFFCVNLFFNDLLIKLSTSQIFKNKVNILFIRIKIIELNNVRMLNIFHDINFPLKKNFLLFIHFLSFLLWKIVLFDDLNSHRLTSCFLATFNHFSIASSKFLKYFILSNEAIFIHSVFLF